MTGAWEFSNGAWEGEGVFSVSKRCIVEASLFGHEGLTTGWIFWWLGNG